MWSQTLSYCQFRAASWRESPECHSAPTKAGRGGQHWVGEIKPALRWLAEKNRWGPWDTPGTSGGDGWARPQVTSSWGDQGILAACGRSPYWLSPRSPRESQGTVYHFALEPFERLKRGSSQNSSAVFSYRQVKNMTLLSSSHQSILNSAHSYFHDIFPKKWYSNLTISPSNEMQKSYSAKSVDFAIRKLIVLK